MISKIKVRWEDKQRALDTITAKLNELIDAVNRDSSPERKPSEYERIRVIEKEDGSIAVQFKSKHGWVESDNSEPTGFKIKEN